MFATTPLVVRPSFFPLGVPSSVGLAKEEKTLARFLAGLRRGVVGREEGA